MVDRSALIELVRDRVPLWDQRDKLYHNRDLRPKLWGEVGKELQIDGDVARKNWELLRDVFRKKIKTINGVPGQVGKTSKWIHFDAMQFLLDVMKPRTTSNNLQVSDIRTVSDAAEASNEVSHTDNESDFSNETDGSSVDDLEEVTTVDNTEQPENESSTSNTVPDRNQVQPPNKGPKRKRNSSTENEALNLERRKVELLECRLSTPQSGKEDDDELFFKSLVPYLKNMQPLQKMKLRSNILNCVISSLEGTESTNRCPPPVLTVSSQYPGYSSEYPPNPCAPPGHDAFNHME